MSPLIVEPYNALLSTHRGMDISDCSFIMDNEALYDICAQKLNVDSPTYTNLNRIIGQVVSAFTASQRFYGSANLSFSEFQTNLVPYPRIHFPLISYAPLVNVAETSYGKLTTEQVTRQCFEPSSQMVRCNPSKGKYMSCILLYRGDVAPGDVNTSINNLKRSNTTRFVDWSPTGFKVGINPMPPSFVQGGDLAPTNRTVLALANNTAIQNAWCRLMIKFNRLISRRAFVHHYVQEGIEEAALKEASENVCTLIRDYQKVDGVDRLSVAEDVPVTMGNERRKGV